MAVALRLKRFSRRRKNTGFMARLSWHGRKSETTLSCFKNVILSPLRGVTKCSSPVNVKSGMVMKNRSRDRKILGASEAVIEDRFLFRLRDQQKDITRGVDLFKTDGQSLELRWRRFFEVSADGFWSEVYCGVAGEVGAGFIEGDVSVGS